MVGREHPHLKGISTGDLLRKASMTLDETGRYIREFLSTGGLFTDKMMANLLFPVLSDCQKWILDGYPRTLIQAQLLEEHLEFLQLSLNAAIIIDIPKEIIEDRMRERWIHPASGRTYSPDFNPPLRLGHDDLTGEPLIKRSDDILETFRKRYDNYEQNLSKIQDFYAERNILTTISGVDSTSIYRQLATRLFPGLIQQS